MSYKKQFSTSVTDRRLRSFSVEFKKLKVREITSGRTTISEICKEYEVSRTSVFRWMSKFGVMGKKKERVVVETDSDTKQLLALKKRIAELERLVGQKQILLDFKEKMIELAEEEYQVDIKKKFSEKPSSTSGETEEK
ncbi:MAG TPA: transposase [Chitinophagales bacterium]|nr:transposase [Chitinophagales bacterium]HNJ90373.1 transposase [Chitinophagales bacterium]HNM28363.1 transposase [Chitinophagales bacterium]